MKIGFPKLLSKCLKAAGKHGRQAVFPKAFFIKRVLPVARLAKPFKYRMCFKHTGTHIYMYIEILLNLHSFILPMNKQGSSRFLMATPDA